MTGGVGCGHRREATGGLLLAASVASPLALVAAGRALAESETIRYAGDAAFAPFESLDAQGKPRGFQIDLLAELAASLGLRFDIKLQAWNRTEADFRNGRADLIAMVDHRRAAGVGRSSATATPHRRSPCTTCRARQILRPFPI